MLHQCADVHRALRMPDQGRLIDAAKSLQPLCFSITKYRLEHMAIRVGGSASPEVCLVISQTLVRQPWVVP
jgi:hypothetical protein